MWIGPDQAPLEKQQQDLGTAPDDLLLPPFRFSCAPSRDSMVLELRMTQFGVALVAKACWSEGGRRVAGQRLVLPPESLVQRRPRGGQPLQKVFVIGLGAAVADGCC